MSEKTKSIFKVNHGEWLLLAAGVIVMLCIFGYAIQHSFSIEEKYLIDYTSESMAFVSSIFILFYLWELRVLINFLSIELDRKIEIGDHGLKVSRGGKEQFFKFKELREVEFSDRVPGYRRTWTASLSYTTLKFKDGASLIITSFNREISEMDKFLKGFPVKRITRDRRFFELIHE
jgi:hypothetical protein